MRLKYIFLIHVFTFLFNSVSAQDEYTQDTLASKVQDDFLKPMSIYKNILSNKLTRENIKSNYELFLINHRGGVDYFDGLETIIGIRFIGQKMSELSFRYFGEEGLEYEESLKKSGFVLKKRVKTSNLEADYSSADIQAFSGELRTYQKGLVICKVYDGSFIGFTFYKTR